MSDTSAGKPSYKSKKLSDRLVDSMRPQDTPFEVKDELTQGLSIRVMPTGRKTWSFRCRMGKRVLRIKIGTTPPLKLADARKEAVKYLRMVQTGGDPFKAKRDARAADDASFGALADLYIEKHAKVHKRSWSVDDRMLRTLVPRSWRHRPAREITRRDIRALVEAKAEKAPIQANRLRALLHVLFAFAVEREIVDHNPVTGVARPGKENPRDRVLSEGEIRTFWAATESMEKPMRAFWRLRLVTGQRQIEIISMRWSDLDLANKVWTIPAGIAKNKQAHRVPLSPLALEILSGLDRFDERVLVGALGNRQRYAAENVLGLENFVGHDLRRTAASNMASLGIPRLHISKVLNHSEKGVTAVYDRHGYDAEKKVALDTWARKLSAILDGTEGAVLPFRAGS